MAKDYMKNSIMLDVTKILLKFVFVIVLIVLFFIIGLFVGYAVVGNGDYWEVLNVDTWQHILDFIQV